MNQENTLLLLKIIKGNGDLRPLIEVGLEYTEIVEVINHLISEGYALKEKGIVSLNEKGVSLINDLNKKFKRLNSGNWIEPSIESRITKIDVNDIFLPQRNELTF